MPCTHIPFFFYYTYLISFLSVFFFFLMTWLMIFENCWRKKSKDWTISEKPWIDWFNSYECCISCCLLSTQTFKRNGSCLISIQTNKQEISALVTVRHRSDLNAGRYDLKKKSFLRGSLPFIQGFGSTPCLWIRHSHSQTAVQQLLRFHEEGLIPGRVLTAIIGPCKWIISQKPCGTVILSCPLCPGGQNRFFFHFI